MALTPEWIAARGAQLFQRAIVADVVRCTPAIHSTAIQVKGRPEGRARRSAAVLSGVSARPVSVGREVPRWARDWQLGADAEDSEGG